MNTVYLWKNITCLQQYIFIYVAPVFHYYCIVLYRWMSVWSIKIMNSNHSYILQLQKKLYCSRFRVRTWSGIAVFHMQVISHSPNSVGKLISTKIWMYLKKKKILELCNMLLTVYVNNDYIYTEYSIFCIHLDLKM